MLKLVSYLLDLVVLWPFVVLFGGLTFIFLPLGTRKIVVASFRIEGSSYKMSIVRCLNFGEA